MASTFSLQNFPLSAEEITFGNNWVPQYLNVPINRSFDICLKKNKENFRSLIGSPKLFGMQKFIALLLILPFNLFKLSIKVLTKKLSMTYSNVPSPVKNYVYCGYKCNSWSGFLPAVGDMMCGFAVVSHGTIIKGALMSDIEYI